MASLGFFGGGGVVRVALVLRSSGASDFHKDNTGFFPMLVPNMGRSDIARHK